MNKKRFFACVAASFFATVTALFTLLSVSQGMGPDHMKPIRILNDILQSNQVSSDEYFPVRLFRDPQPVSQEFTAKNASSLTSLSSLASSSSEAALTSSKKESAISLSHTKTTTSSSSPLSSLPKSSSANPNRKSSSKTSTTAAPPKSTSTSSTSKRAQPSPTFASKLPSTIKKATTKALTTTPLSTHLSIASPSTTSSPSASYICPTFTGRLGNNLFQFASGYGIAASKSVQFVIGDGDSMNKIFKLKTDNHLIISKTRRECAAAKFRGEGRASGFDPNVLKFKADTTYRVGNFLQSWKYFHNVSREIREQLKFRDHIQTKANNTINGALQKYNTTREKVTVIGIHVRRGDMVNHGFGYQVATKEYFAKAVALFSNYSSPLYIVCTNDLAWSKANIPKSNKIEFVSGNSAEVDMAVMASCDHMITSVGSYGWWAGWLSNGTVTYYKWPAKEGSSLRSAYSADYMDYFYPHWIGL